MKEFRINQYITLRLENDKTIIYVNDKEFWQCKYLLLNIPVDKINSYDEVESIDEAAEFLNHKQEFKGEEIIISPEEEFWAHCSNLQAWVENDYDTRLLHSNIAFPLLEKLVNSGVSEVKHVFKEEIAKRLLSKHDTVIHFLIKEGYLEYLSRIELETVLDAFTSHDFEALDIYMIFSLLRLLKKHSLDLGEYRDKLKREIYERILVDDGSDLYFLYRKAEFIKYIDREVLHILLEEIIYPEINTIRFELLSILLKEIYERGILRAKKLLKREISKQFKSGHHKNLIHIIDRDFLDIFTENEINSLFKLLKNSQYFNLYQLSKSFKSMPFDPDFIPQPKFHTRFDNNNLVINLDLTGKDLKEIPKSVFNFSYLTGLILKNNNLSEIPHEIQNLERLRMLDLDSNKFSSFPEQVCNLTYLEELYLNENKINVIPDSIRKISNLKILQLRENYIIKIPEAIMHLKNIRNLVLSNNQLKTLPDFLLKIPSLRFIDVIDNPELIISKKLIDALKDKGISILISHPNPKYLAYFRRPRDINP